MRDHSLPLSLGAIIFVVCFLTVSNWFQGKIIYNWDQGFFPINAFGQFRNSFYVWVVNQSTGNVAAPNLVGVVFFGIQWGFSLLLPSQLSAQAFLTTFYFSAGIGMFLLLRDILNSPDKLGPPFTDIIAFVGALFYLFNPIWTLGGIVNPVQNTIFVVAFLPYLFLSLRKLLVSIVGTGTCSKLNFVATIILANIVLPMTGVYVPFVLLLTLLYITIYFITASRTTQSRHFLRGLRSIAIVVIGIIGSSLWYVLPLYLISANQVLGSGVARSNFISSSFSDVVANSVYTPFLSDVRLVGFRIPPNIFPVSNPSAAFYTSPLFLSLSTAFALIIFLPLVMDKKNPDSIACTVLSLLVIVGWAGVNPPLGSIYKMLFLNLYIFVIFRTPALAFGYLAMFLFSILFAQGIWLVTKRMSKLPSTPTASPNRGVTRRQRTVFLVVVITLLIVMIPYASPIFSGANMTSTWGIPSRIEVPPSYLQASDYLNSHSNISTVVLLPPDATLHASSWYMGLNVFYWLLKDKGTITGGYGTIPAIQDMYNFYFESLLQNRTSSVDLNHILDVLNSQYVVLQSDGVPVPGVEGPANTTLLLKSLDDQAGLSRVATFGNITIFKNSDQTSLIHAARLNITSTPSSLIQILSSQRFQPLTTAIFSDNVSNLYYADSSRSDFVDSLASTVGELPRIEFSQVSPVDYVVTVVNSTGPFFLVFSQTYNEQWKASINRNYLGDQYHLAVNGYANAWYVNKTGNFQIDLRFITQSQIYGFLLVSATSAILAYVMMFYVIPAVTRPRKHNAI